MLANRQFHPTYPAIEIVEGVAIRGVAAGGRTPVTADPVQDLIVHGKWTMPKEGDQLGTQRGAMASWRHVTSGKDGGFAGLGGGYLASEVDVDGDRAMVLEASGDGVVYVNGSPRAGDNYGFGTLKLPVWLHKGQNTLLFAA